FFFGAVIAVPVGTVAFTRLVEHVAGEKWRDLMTTIRRTLWVTLLISVPATLVLTLFGREVVHVLFERGAFGHSSTNVTASILQIYALALVPMALIEILLRAFFALDHQRLALGFLGFSLALNVGVNFWLLGRLGVEAVAVGAVVGIWTSFLLMGGYLLRVMRSLGGIDSANSVSA